MIVVVDASVALKWVLRDSPSEGHTEEALGVLAAIHGGEVEAVQPPHWLLEVAAALVRLWPRAANDLIDRLDLMGLPIVGDPTVLHRAIHLAHELDHHLFDTLYHAVALERGGTLVTADGRYARKARHLGSVVELRDWESPSVVQ